MVPTRHCNRRLVQLVADEHYVPVVTHLSDSPNHLEPGVICTRNASVLTVTLNRPAKRNAMGPSTWKALADIGAAVDSDVRVVVIRGAGKAFSAGLDLQLFATGTAAGYDGSFSKLFEATPDEFDQIVEGYQAGFTWLRNPQFISVAAVQGYAIGAGLQLALACDLRLASSDVKFSMREPALGVVPDLTGTTTLVNAVGYARALEWTATARWIEANEALASGLVSQIVPAEELDAAVAGLVQKLTAHPHGAVTATKALLLGATEHGYDEQRAYERAEQFQRFAAMAADRQA